MKKAIAGQEKTCFPSDFHQTKHFNQPKLYVGDGTAHHSVLSAPRNTGAIKCLWPPKTNAAGMLLQFNDVSGRCQWHILQIQGMLSLVLAS
jgi:hypothetical protein